MNKYMKIFTSLWPQKKNGNSRESTQREGNIHVLSSDDRQITHLICVSLKHLLYDFVGGVLGLLPVVFLYKRPKTPPEKVI